MDIITHFKEDIQKQINYFKKK